MNKEEQNRWNTMVSSHWWVRGHQWIAEELTKKYLKDFDKRNTKLLDIGCSGGSITEFLKQFGMVYGFDISFDGLVYAKNRKLQVVQSDATRIPFKNNSFDAISIFEVSEHVDDDYALFQEAYRVCKMSGLIFVMVPAYKFLWGSHDVKYSHKRRYTKHSFLNLIKSHNFKIEKLTFLHPQLLLPLIFLRSIDRWNEKNLGQRDDFLSLGITLDSILYKMLLLEGKIVSNISFPFGICMFCILRKNG